MKKITDNDLLVLIRRGDFFAFTKLYEKYLNYSIGQANQALKANKTNSTFDELLSACLFALIKSIRMYSGEGNSFYLYWLKCAKNEMIKEMRKTHEYYALNDCFVDGIDFYGRPNAEKIGVVDQGAQENLFKDDLDFAITKNLMKFTKAEKRVFVQKYKLKKSSKEVAQSLNKSISVVNRHYKKALVKFVKFVKEHYIK